MKQSNIIISLLLAVIAGLLIAPSFSASSAVVTAGGSGPVKPVPWTHG